MLYTKKLGVLSKGGFYAVDITDDVRGVVVESDIREVSALIFYRHMTV